MCRPARFGQTEARVSLIARSRASARGSATDCGNMSRAVRRTGSPALSVGEFGLDEAFHGSLDPEYLARENFARRWVQEIGLAIEGRNQRF